MTLNLAWSVWSIGELQLIRSMISGLSSGRFASELISKASLKACDARSNRFGSSVCKVNKACPCVTESPGRACHCTPAPACTSSP